MSFHLALDPPKQPGTHAMNATEHDEPKDRTRPATSTKVGTFELELTPSSFREWVRDQPGARYRPEAGRYHLYVMYGCPWAHRTLIVRALKGLEHAVDVTAVHHRLNEEEGLGWAFSPDEPEPLYGARRLRELYVMADPDYSGRVTVPVLWDKREQTIVNNESSEIIRMLGGAFDDFAARPELDLYPEPLRPAIDRWNERIYSAINLGAYRVGFATTQVDYEEAVYTFFDALDELEAHLGAHRYLVGDRPTEADWRLLPTLIRFEWVYHGLFKCNLRRLVDYPTLLRLHARALPVAGHRAHHQRASHSPRLLQQHAQAQPDGHRARRPPGRFQRPARPRLILARNRARPRGAAKVLGPSARPCRRNRNRP